MDEIKQCTKCMETKPYGDFNWQNRPKNQKHKWCKECTKTSKKLSYKKYRQEQIDRVKKRTKEIKLQNETRMFEYLASHPCKCGESNPLVLQFDHIDGEKIMAISMMMCRRYAWTTIQSEIDKCQVLCANCHAIKTAISQGNWKLRYMPYANRTN